MPTHVNRALVKNDVLWTYLTTHQKIGTAVLQRVGWMLDDAEDLLMTALQGLRCDVETEQVWLVNLLRTVQLPTTTVWSSSTLTADVIHTLMLTRRRLCGSGLSPVIDIESLISSVDARLLLWQTLGDLTDVLPVEREHVVVFHRNGRRQLKDLNEAYELLRRDVFVA